MFAAKIENSIVFVFVVQCLTQHTVCALSGVWGWFVSKVCVGGFSVEGTPGPVPIPVAKLDCADGTAIVGLWESKTPPTHQKLHKCGVCRILQKEGHTPHTFYALFLFALECTPRARVGGYGLPHY